MTDNNTDTTTTARSALRRPRGRALGFVAGAAFMCVLSAGVGAGAATLVTSAQIADGTIVGRDVKNGGLTGRDVRNGSLTGTDVKNNTIGSGDLRDGSVRGADVKNGTIGVADLSAAVAARMVDAPIPSGTTVTGIEYLDTTSTVSGDFVVSVTLPGRAHDLLSNQMVKFGGTDPRVGDASTECAGSVDTPTAPAGIVCIYLLAAAADSSSIVGVNLGGTSSDQAFAVAWTDNASASADVFVMFTWAYTAP